MHMFSSGARCFQECGSFKIPWKIGGRESGRKPCSQTPTYDTPATAGKHSRDVGNSRDPSSNRNASFKQGTPLGEGTNSIAKMSATAGAVWKSYESGRK
jgi:hypothetical protein